MTSGWEIFSITFEIVVLVALIISVIYMLTLESNTPSIATGSIGSKCSITSDCPGLTCSNGLCAIPIGGNCSNNVNSCTSGSSCINSECKSNEIKVVQVAYPQPSMIQSIAPTYTTDKLAVSKNLALKALSKSNIIYNSENIPCDDIQEDECVCEEETYSNQEPPQSYNNQQPLQSYNNQQPQQFNNQQPQQFNTQQPLQFSNQQHQFSNQQPQFSNQQPQQFNNQQSLPQTMEQVLQYRNNQNRQN